MKKYTSKLLILASLTFLPQQAMEKKERQQLEIISLILDINSINNLAKIKELVKKFGFDFNCKLKHQNSNIEAPLLHLFMIKNKDTKNIEVLKYLIKNNANVTNVDSEKRTVLHYCTKNLESLFCIISMAKSQINNEINFKKWINKEDDTGNTALHYCPTDKNPCAELLLECGADSTIANKNGKKPNHKELEKKIKKERFIIICFQKENNPYSVQLFPCKNHFDIKKTIKEFAGKNKLNSIHILTDLGWVVFDETSNLFFELGDRNDLGKLKSKMKQFKINEVNYSNKIELFSIGDSKNEIEIYILMLKAINNLLNREKKKKIAKVVGVIFLVIILAYLASLAISKIKKKKISEKKKNIRKRKKRGRSYKRK